MTIVYALTDSTCEKIMSRLERGHESLGTVSHHLHVGEKRLSSRLKEYSIDRYEAWIHRRRVDKATAAARIFNARKKANLPMKAKPDHGDLKPHVWWINQDVKMPPSTVKPRWPVRLMHEFTREELSSIQEKLTQWKGRNRYGHDRESGIDGTDHVGDDGNDGVGGVC